jgi:hypothetical protein
MALEVGRALEVVDVAVVAPNVGNAAPFSVM